MQTLFAHRWNRWLVATVLIGAATGSSAQGPGSDCDLRIAGGPAGKVYELMIRDMQQVCGQAVRVCPVASSGGLQNLSLLSASEAELGIVQVDTWHEMKGGDENVRALQAVLPLHANLVHVLTLAEGSKVDTWTVPWFGTAIPFTGKMVAFRKFSELGGRTLAVVGSAKLMGPVLESQFQLRMKFVTADSDDHAVRLLRSGEVQAVMTLGGWPLPTVAVLKAGSGLVLANFDLTALAPYVTARRSYQNLDAYNLTFLGAPNVLVTRPFKPGGPAAQRTAALQRCLVARLDELQEGRYQAPWKEVRDVSLTYGLPPLQREVAVKSAVQ